MFRNAEYQHPQLEPYFSGSWKEIVFSWVIAATFVGGVLLSM